MTEPSPYDAALAQITVSRRHADVGGASTVWHVYGNENAPTTIIAVHGFRGDHHGLEPVVAQLESVASGRVSIVMPDLPGFGESSALTTNHTVEAYARWLGSFAAHVASTSRTVLLGHSFGSIVVAASLAERFVDADAVVLVNPIAAPALAGPRGIMTRLAVAYYQVAAALPEPIGLAILRSPLIVRIMSITMAKTRDPSLRRWIHDQHSRYFSLFADRRSVLEAFRTSVTHDVSEYASRIDQPVLLVAAQRDDIAPLAAQERIQPMFSRARLRVIPAVGHLIHYETPGAAAAYITEFLTSLELLDNHEELAP